MKIVWPRRAIWRLVHIRDYIAKDNPGAAARIAERILQSVEALTGQPDMGRPGRIAGTRELVVPATPYVIPYRVRAGRLELLAVFHGRQKWPVKL